MKKIALLAIGLIGMACLAFANGGQQSGGAAATSGGAKASSTPKAETLTVWDIK
jgi:hypothetical protein